MVSFGAEGAVGVASDRGDLVAMYRVIFKSLLDRTGAAAALLEPLLGANEALVNRPGHVSEVELEKPDTRSSRDIKATSP